MEAKGFAVYRLVQETGVVVIFVVHQSVCPLVCRWRSHPVVSQSLKADVVSQLTRGSCGSEISPMDFALEGVLGATTMSPPFNEALVFSSIMEDIVSLPVSTITHIPCKVQRNIQS